MAGFQVNDEVRVIINGEEVRGKINGFNGPDAVIVRTDNGTSLIERAKLLRPKGPFFEIRGQVLTTSATHPGEVGEIISTGSSKSGKLFFEVLFKNGDAAWFDEDNVFIDDKVGPKSTPVTQLT